MTTTAPGSTPTAPTVPTAHFRLAVLALAVGGFAIGTTEFVTMGLIREVADGVDISIPDAAGHVISAYALGVVVGRRRVLRRPLAAARAAGGPDDGVRRLHALSAVATSSRCFWWPGSSTASRTAYFGVASLVAASLAPPGRKGQEWRW